MPHPSLQVRSDEEVIEETEAAPVQWLADGRAYDALRRSDPELLAAALEAAEMGRWMVVTALLPGKLPPGQKRGRESYAGIIIIRSVLLDFACRVTKERMVTKIRCEYPGLVRSQNSG